MKPNELLQKLLSESRPALTALFQECQSRFVNAAQLLEISDTEIRRVRDVPKVDLRPLLNLYETLCSRYVKDVYTPQMDLFISKDPLQYWRTYYYHDLIPDLISNDEVVRNVLKATSILPTNDVVKSIVALTESAEYFTFKEYGRHTQPSDS